MDSTQPGFLAAFSGVVAVLTACITGTFRIANTLIQDGFIISGPVELQGAGEVVELSGQIDPTSVCWIGPQPA
jgi:hypothetical protein